MNKAQIQQLVVKYFEGNTTLEEEKLLREFFTTDHETDVDLVPLKKQYELFDTARQFLFDTGKLESEILRRISNDESDAVVPVRKISLPRWLFAASFILVIFTGVLFLRNKDKEIKDTYSDPQLAYVETQKALMLVSKKMNKGIEPLSNINKINTSTQQLKKLDKMDKSLEMLNLVSFINQSSNLKK